jgi:predicted N-acetyltransferase YhbS
VSPGNDLVVVEFGPLGAAQRTELEGDEDDPFDARGTTLTWRRKERHVALADATGRLIASSGLLEAEVQVDDGPLMPVVGIGGVIVARAHRGQGLADRVITEALRRAATLGPDAALLFCLPDRAGLYERHGFVELRPPVLVQQPSGLVPFPDVAMWRTIRGDAPPPAGQVTVFSLPF